VTATVDPASRPGMRSVTVVDDRHQRRVAERGGDSSPVPDRRGWVSGARRGAAGQPMALSVFGTVSFGLIL
jgi:hypothetical protein